MNAPVKIDSAFIATELEDEIVLVGMDSGEFLSLEGTARAIWAAIDGSRTVSAITDLMESRFEGAKLDIAQQTQQFLEELREAGFIDWSRK